MSAGTGHKIICPLPEITQCMKRVYGFLMSIAVILICCAGCTSTPQPAATPVPTTVTATATAMPVPAITSYPGALAPGTAAPFGIGGRNGTAVVYKADLRPEYTWTSPSFNSISEQKQTGEALGTQKGYNTQKPSEGNAFLFVYMKLADTGSGNIVAPSPSQFIVNYNGKDYTYSSLAGPDVTLGGVTGTQYDYLIGKGGVAGYIQPGESNAVDGFLIYEVPASIDLTKASMIITLDAVHTPAWQLA